MFFTVLNEKFDVVLPQTIDYFLKYARLSKPD